MLRVLVSGGTGTLGRELAPRFAGAGYTVRVMSRRPRFHRDSLRRVAAFRFFMVEGIGA